MKKYTQEEFDNLPVVDDVKQCPTGDYSAIKTFGERCSFGKRCSICNHELTGFKMRSISGLGEYKRTLYIWDTVDGIYCQAGCFFDTQEEFTKSVTEKYHSEHAYIKAVEFLTSDWSK